MLDLANLADIHYVRQGEALGLGHAVATARKHVGDQPFAVMLGDDIMDEHSTVLSEMIDAHAATGAAAVIACKHFPLEEISAYGSIAYEEVGAAAAQGARASSRSPSPRRRRRPGA